MLTRCKNCGAAPAPCSHAYYPFFVFLGSSNRLHPTRQRTFTLNTSNKVVPRKEVFFGARKVNLNI